MTEEKVEEKLQGEDLEKAAEKESLETESSGKSVEIKPEKSLEERKKEL